MYFENLNLNHLEADFTNIILSKGSGTITVQNRIRNNIGNKKIVHY